MASTGGALPKMSDEEKFFFDLNGFLHVRGALSKEEVDSMNKAIDVHSSEIKVGPPARPKPSMQCLGLTQRSAKTATFATQAAWQRHS